MKRFFVFLLCWLCLGQGYSQTAARLSPSRPKLVVAIVVDQMRWDFLYRFADRYGPGGFNRLLGEGFSCEHTMINYLPSYTAVGHSTIFTGTVPSIHGITGNDWTDQLSGKQVYCTADSTVMSVGNDSEDGKMSPRNLLVTTITDELRMATNFRSRVVGISLKDRAAILPAGHTATAAFWLDDASGHFITSSYYMNALPEWVRAFNNTQPVEKLISGGWHTLYPLSSYIQSDSDAQSYEGRFKTETSPVFPHEIQKIYETTRGSFRQTPFGNTLTLDFARSAVEGYHLGKGPVTDFLTINCASTDYVGHMYGPNSVEIEDTYLRLDRDLAAFFVFLDRQIGKGNYLLLLTADHGVAHSIGYMKKNRLPGEFMNAKPLVDSLNRSLAEMFGADRLVRSAMNNQLNFDLGRIQTLHLDFPAIRKASVDFLQRQPGIAYAVDLASPGTAPVPEPIKTMITNGYHFTRSGSVAIIASPGWMEGYAKTGSTHGSWNPYDTHIPLVFMGWGIHHGNTSRPVNMTDIAATLAELLHIQMPSGCIGMPITEVLGNP